MFWEPLLVLSTFVFFSFHVSSVIEDVSFSLFLLIDLLLWGSQARPL